ncbi:MAG: hypothetical protein SAK29_28265, partial [Scytonema sp. PMC 1069.18]|nr:hypothetical protein [Scytonema sp. PMC 1069.18]
MRTPIGPVPVNTRKVPAQNYAPSVPLSVYRDLASELQAVQAKLDTMSVQNEKLLQENQFLKQEIAKAVGSVLNLQKLVDVQPKGSDRPPYFQRSTTEPKKSVNEERFEKQVSPPRSPVIFGEVEIPNQIPETVYVEEQEENYLLDSEPEPSPINRFWIIIS